MNEGELFGNVVWREGGLLCEAEEGHELDDQNNGAGVERAGSGDQGVGRL